jgi:hypothetical protein
MRPRQILDPGSLTRLASRVTTVVVRSSRPLAPVRRASPHASPRALRAHINQRSRAAIVTRNPWDARAGPRPRDELNAPDSRSRHRRGRRRRRPKLAQQSSRCRLVRRRSLLHRSPICPGPGGRRLWISSSDWWSANASFTPISKTRSAVSSNKGRAGPWWPTQSASAGKGPASVTGTWPEASHGLRPPRTASPGR